MKRGKKPTRRQKIRIKSYGLNPDNWLVIRECKDCFEIRHKISGNVKRFEQNKTSEFHKKNQRKQAEIDKSILSQIARP